MHRYGYTQSITQRTAQHTTRRAVLGLWALLIVLLVFMGVRWHAQQAHNPFLIPTVGASASLSEGTEALIVLFRSSRNNHPLDTLRSAFLTTDARVIALNERGGIVDVTGDIDSYGSKLARPHGWFLPGTVGAVYARDGNRVRTARLRYADGGLSTALSHGGKPIASVLSDAILGAYVDCEAGCDLTAFGLHDPLADFGGAANIFQHTDGHLLLVADIDQESSIVALLDAHARFTNPETQEKRLPDGTTYQELIPAETVDRSTMGNYDRIGGDLFSWYVARDDNKIYASTSERVVSDLSTLSWTNSICGIRPTFYTHVNSSLTLDEQTAQEIFFVQGRKRLRICLE